MADAAAAQRVLVREVITGLSPLPNEAIINPNCLKCNWLILGD